MSSISSTLRFGSHNTALVAINAINTLFVNINHPKVRSAKKTFGDLTTALKNDPIVKHFLIRKHGLVATDASEGQQMHLCLIPQDKLFTAIRSKGFPYGKKLHETLMRLVDEDLVDYNRINSSSVKLTESIGDAEVVCEVVSDACADDISTAASSASALEAATVVNAAPIELLDVTREPSPHFVALFNYIRADSVLVPKRIDGTDVFVTFKSMCKMFGLTEKVVKGVVGEVALAKKTITMPALKNSKMIQVAVQSIDFWMDNEDSLLAICGKQNLKSLNSLKNAFIKKTNAALAVSPLSRSNPKSTIQVELEEENLHFEVVDDDAKLTASLAIQHKMGASPPSDDVIEVRNNTIRNQMSVVQTNHVDVLTEVFKKINPTPSIEDQTHLEIVEARKNSRGNNLPTIYSFAVGSLNDMITDRNTIRTWLDKAGVMYDTTETDLCLQHEFGRSLIYKLGQTTDPMGRNGQHVSHFVRFSAAPVLDNRYRVFPMPYLAAFNENGLTHCETSFFKTVVNEQSLRGGVFRVAPIYIGPKSINDTKEGEDTELFLVLRSHISLFNAFLDKLEVESRTPNSINLFKGAGESVESWISTCFNGSTAFAETYSTTYSEEFQVAGMMVGGCLSVTNRAMDLVEKSLDRSTTMYREMRAEADVREAKLDARMAKFEETKAAQEAKLAEVKAAQEAKLAEARVAQEAKLEEARAKIEGKLDAKEKQVIELTAELLSIYRKK